MPHAMQIRRTGGPEVLNWSAVDVGELGPDQMRVRQGAAGLNYIDVYHRTGYYPQRINVNQRFALKDAADAHMALEARATSGSNVLTI